MKKIFAFLLIIICLFTIVGCNSNSNNDNDAQINSTQNKDDYTKYDANDENIPEIIKETYKNLFQYEIVHISAENNLKNNLIVEENKDSDTHIKQEVESESQPIESDYFTILEDYNTEDVQYMGHLEEKTWDIWFNNRTKEFVVKECIPVEESVSAQLKKDCEYEGDKYEYIFYHSFDNSLGGSSLKHYEESDVGYETIYYEHLGLLPLLESTFNIKITDDDKYYLLTSDPIIWDDFYISDPTSITLKIDANTLCLEKIDVESVNWHETVSLEYYDSSNQEKFYQQFPDEIHTNEVTGTTFYKNKSECDEPFLMYTYDEIKQIMQEDIEAGYITSEDGFTVIE